MHHLDLGLFNYQVTFTRELLKELCDQAAVNELDNRLSSIPRFLGLKIFKNSLENIKRFTANDFRNNSLRSEEHTSELQSRSDIVCRLLLEKKKPYKSVISRST